MRKILSLLTVLVVSTITLFAENLSSDSIALRNIDHRGLFLVKNETVVSMIPIRQNRVKVSGFIAVSAKTIYDGKESKTVLESGESVYVYIPSEMKNSYFIENFRLVEFVVTKKGRSLKVSSAMPFSASVGVDAETIGFMQISANLYKLIIPSKIKKGCYGIFYDYMNGVPCNMYDFDIK